MIRLFKAFLHDALSWGLMVLLVVSVIAAISAYFNRYDRLDRYQKRLFEMAYDITVLENRLEDRKMWVERLETDVTAIEQVAREKMNYLGPDEVLVTFYPAPLKK